MISWSNDIQYKNGDYIVTLVDRQITQTFTRIRFNSEENSVDVFRRGPGAKPMNGEQPYSSLELRNKRKPLALYDSDAKCLVFAVTEGENMHTLKIWENGTFRLGESTSHKGRETRNSLKRGR